MKRLTRSEIKAELEKPNGSAEIMNDSTIDKISLCDETTAMFIEENLGADDTPCKKPRNAAPHERQPCSSAGDAQSPCKRCLPEAPPQCSKAYRPFHKG